MSALLVFSNTRLGPAAEVLISSAIASTLLVRIADAARPIANGLWEVELVRWLDDQVERIRTATGVDLAIEISDIAFTPLHFERQRRFLIEAIEAARTPETARTLARLAKLIEAHPRASIQVSRRWHWHTSA